MTFVRLIAALIAALLSLALVVVGILYLFDVDVFGMTAGGYYQNFIVGILIMIYVNTNTIVNRVSR